MTDEDHIRDSLDGTDIEILNIDSDGMGMYATIEVTGTEQKLRRLVGGDFDIQGNVLESSEGSTARVRPKR